MLRGRHFRWGGVPVARYGDAGDERPVTRQVLRAPGPDRSGLAFETRYFEVEPGGSTALEHHAHGHAVVIIRGRGEVLLGDRCEPVAPFDYVFVAPHEWHQFRATPEEPLGFLCMVDRDRHHGGGSIEPSR